MGTYHNVSKVTFVRFSQSRVLTRHAFDNKLSYNVIVNIITRVKTMFKFKRPKILNKVKDLKVYREANSKIYFGRRYKALAIKQHIL